MGLTDRFKDLKTKAEDAVAEHSDQIHSAVEKATAAADQRTGGKYSERIQNLGAKADGLVSSLHDADEQPVADGEAPAAEGEATAEQ